jgi:peptide methionine sulfoxide reductase MsrB
MAYLAANGEVFSKHYQDGRVTIHCRVAQQHLGAVHGDDVQIRRR